MTIRVSADKSVPPFLYIRSPQQDSVFVKEYITELYNDCFGCDSSYLSVCEEKYTEGVIFYPNLDKAQRKPVMVIESHKCFVPLEREEDVAHYQTRSRHGDICSLNFSVNI
jgi:hypothetical protein